MNLTTPPPEKLSDLLELAIADARKLDHDHYVPDWSVWHRPRPLDNKCQICLAGAVIAGTLGCPAGTDIDIFTVDETDPESINVTDERWQKALGALDSAREGHWLTAVEALQGDCHDTNVIEKLDDLGPAAHSEFGDWCQFNRHLNSLKQCASQLRELGL